MQFIALNKEYEIVALLNPVNVQWNRRYYEPGDFSIQIHAKDYLTEMKYVYCKDRPELGMIQKTEYDEEITGIYIQISGFFLEKELDDKIVDGIVNKTGTGETLARYLFGRYKKDIPDLLTATADSKLGTVVNLQTSYGNLGQTIYSLLESQELSYNIQFHYGTKKKRFTVYQGKDRTQSQTVNNYVQFSTSLGNIRDPNVQVDESNFKNYALVGGSGEGYARIKEVVDMSGGGYQKQIFVDAKDLSYNEEEQTLAEYKAELKQRGIEKLLEYQIVNNVTFNASASGYEYMVDFDLGDKCDVIINSLQLMLECRIIAVYEVIKDNSHTLELAFGNKIAKG